MSQSYVYGPPGPDTVRPIEPLSPPLQDGSTGLVVHVIAIGSPTTASHSVVQPLSSVTTTIYVPAARPEAVAVV